MLDSVQNDAMRVILGRTKGTPIETIRYVLDLLTMKQDVRGEGSQSVSQWDAEFQDPLHDAVREEKTGKRQVMGESSRTVNPACVWPHGAGESKDWGKLKP